jgi:hypothetical protein
MYPPLCNIAGNKHAIKAFVLGAANPNMDFHCTLLCQHLADWNAIILRVVEAQLSQEHDSLRWDLHPTGVFLVHTMSSAGQIQVKVTLLPLSTTTWHGGPDHAPAVSFAPAWSTVTPWNGCGQRSSKTHRWWTAIVIWARGGFSGLVLWHEDTKGGCPGHGGGGLLLRRRRWSASWSPRRVGEARMPTETPTPGTPGDGGVTHCYLVEGIIIAARV